MSAKIKYTNAPLGRVKIVRDFLPPPEDLVFRDEGVKVTIALSTHSVQFFKDEARKHKTQYQRMIRRLLDAYAAHHSQPPDIRPARPRTVRRARANIMNEGGRDDLGSGHVARRPANSLFGARDGESDVAPAHSAKHHSRNTWNLDVQLPTEVYKAGPRPLDACEV